MALVRQCLPLLKYWPLLFCSKTNDGLSYNQYGQQGQGYGGHQKSSGYSSGYGSSNQYGGGSSGSSSNQQYGGYNQNSYNSNNYSAKSTSYNQDSLSSKSGGYTTTGHQGDSSVLNNAAAAVLGQTSTTNALSGKISATTASKSLFVATNIFFGSTFYHIASSLGSMKAYCTFFSPFPNFAARWRERILLNNAISFKNFQAFLCYIN